MSNYLPFVRNRALSNYEVVRFFMREMNCGYHQQFYRPMQTHGHARVINALAGTWNTSAKNQGTFNQNANSFIAPQATAGNQVVIANGWEHSRFMWYLEVRDRTEDFTARYGIIGFTDHVGASIQSGAVDPNMQMYFNTILKFDDQQRRMPNGQMRIKSRLLSCSNILMNPTLLDVNHGFARNHFETINPNDVTQAMALYDATGFVDPNEHQVINTTNKFSGGRRVVLSNMGNQVSSTYLGKIMNGIHTVANNVVNDPGMCQIDNPAEYSGFVASLVADPLQAHNVDLIAELEKRFNLGNKPFVTFANIGELFPAIHDPRIGKVDLLPPAARVMGQYSNYTQSFNGASPEVVTAFSIATAVPALMLSVGLIDVGFTATNSTITHEWVINIAADPFTGSHARAINDEINIGDLLQYFFEKLKQELLYGLSHGGHAEIIMTVFCDIYGDIKIDIGMNGGPITPFAQPAFCSANYSPLLSTDPRRIESIASDLIQLRGACGLDYDSISLQQAPNVSLSSLL